MKHYSANISDHPFANVLHSISVARRELSADRESGIRNDLIHLKLHTMLLS